MTTKPTFPTILLPGPCIAAYTITIKGSSTNWDGSPVSRVANIQGTGSPTEVVDYLNSAYSFWYPILGEEITLDYGKGPMRRVLSESFGRLFLEGVK